MTTTKLPPQHQDRQPGKQYEMRPQPKTDSGQPGSNRLKGRVMLVTGGDSGIGRAIAVAAAKEGASVAFTYMRQEERDARETQGLLEGQGGSFLAIPTNLDDEAACAAVVDAAVDRFGKLDVLVNDAGEQHPQARPEDISAAQLQQTFKTNVFAQFYTVKAALPHMGKGGSIVTIASVTAYEGSPKLVDYSSSKGALVSFVRALSNAVIDRGIRVNAVAPGPIWTPLIAATFSDEEISKFGQDVPMKRPGQPYEVAAAVIFLASDEASYVSGQTIHVNGGTVVNG